MREKIVKLPGSLKDKLCAALGLSLVCGIALPLEPVEAKAKKAKAAETKAEKPTAKDKSKPHEPELEAKQTPQAPQPAKDPCPACGRG